MTDTHTHLYLSEYDADRDAVMRRALDAGVSRMVLPNVDLTTVGPMQSLHRQYPDNTVMAMGLHPEEVRDDWREALDGIGRHLADGHYAAIGEIGVDLYWDATHAREQQEVFATQLRWAAELGLPAIIHCRNALEQVLEALEAMPEPPQAIFHCFTGTPDDVRRIRRCGDFYFGIGGVLTFKRSTLPEALPVIGLDRILLETDSPYMAPVPMRGKRNESAYIPHICRAAALALQLRPEQVAEATDASAARLFGL